MLKNNKIEKTRVQNKMTLKTASNQSKNYWEINEHVWTVFILYDQKWKNSNKTMHTSNNKYTENTKRKGAARRQRGK